MTQVIIVEDNPDLLEFTQEVLQDKGYQVVTASTGSQFLDLLKSQSPNLIVMDINLPDAQGHKLAHDLKQTDKFNQTPVLIISSDNQIKEKAHFAQADSFLAKPFELDDFIAEVEKLIQS